MIVGTYALEGDTLKVEAHSIRIDVGGCSPTSPNRAPSTICSASSSRLARRLAPDTRRASRRPPATAAARRVRELHQRAHRREPAAQATFLETAVKLFAGYDRAELALWEVRTDQGDHAAALAAARAVRPHSRSARRARFLSGVSLLDLKRYDEAFDLFKALVDDAPVPPLGTGNEPGRRGVEQPRRRRIRRGATPQTGTATFYLTKAAEADPGDADYLFNLGYAYVLERNTRGRSTGCAKALRRDPADPDAHYVLAAALQAAGSTVEAEREKELARQLSSRYEELERRAAADKLPVPRGLERVRTDPDTAGGLRPEQAIVNTAQRDQRELATFHLDRGRRLYEREEDREAMMELRRAVYLSPYEAQAHLLIGRIHLRAGRPAGSGRRAEDFDLERRYRRRADRAGRGLPEAAERRPPPAPSSSARWRSIRRRPRQSGCSGMEIK